MWSHQCSLLFLGSALLLACPSASVPEPPTPEPTPQPSEPAAELMFSSTAYARPSLGGDLTGDGVDNLVVQDQSGNLVVLNSPLTEIPSILATLAPELPAQAAAPMVGDLDGNGVFDLFTHEPGGGHVWEYYSPLDSSLLGHDWDFSAGPRSGLGQAGGTVDLDGDGGQDLLLAGPGVPDPACGEDAVGTLLFRAPIQSGPLTPADADTVFRDEGALASCDGWFVRALDANDDAVLDVMIGGRDGMAHIYFGPIPPGTLTRADADIVLGDPGSDTWFWNDGVGVPGGVLLGYGQPGDVSALGMAFVPGPLSAGTVAPADASIWVTPSDAFGPVRVAAGDWNRDGLVDAAVTVTGGSEVSIVLGPLGDNSARVGPRIPLVVGSGALFTADVDGDGRDELITGDEEMGFSVWRVRMPE